MGDITNIENTYDIELINGEWEEEISWNIYSGGVQIGNTISYSAEGLVIDNGVATASPKVSVSLKVGETYTIEMVDDYGDGWNGSTLIFDLNLSGSQDNQDLQITLPSGASGSESFNIPLYFDADLNLKRSVDKSGEDNINFSSFESDILSESSTLNYTDSELNILSNSIYDGTSSENENLENKLISKGFASYPKSSLDYTGFDLSGKDFSNANLTGLNLTNTNLTNTNFTDSQLTNAILEGATLIGTNFTNVDLSGRDFTGFNLTNVNLTGANITGCDFTGLLGSSSTQHQENHMGYSITSDTGFMIYQYDEKSVSFSNLHNAWNIFFSPEDVKVTVPKAGKYMMNIKVISRANSNGEFNLKSFTVNTNTTYNALDYTQKFQDYNTDLPYDESENIGYLRTGSGLEYIVDLEAGENTIQFLLSTADFQHTHRTFQVTIYHIALTDDNTDSVNFPVTEDIIRNTLTDSKYDATLYIESHNPQYNQLTLKRDHKITLDGNKIYFDEVEIDRTLVGRIKVDDGCTRIIAPPSLFAYSSEINPELKSFSGNKNLRFIHAPKLLFNQQLITFLGLYNLREISSRDNNGEYGGTESIFQNMTGVTNIYLGKLHFIQTGYQFNSLSSITKIDLRNLTYIQGGNTFTNCTNLKYIRLDNLQYFDSSEMFKGCSNLKMLYIPNKKGVMFSNMFDDDAADNFYYIPYGEENNDNPLPPGVKTTLDGTVYSVRNDILVGPLGANDTDLRYINLSGVNLSGADLNNYVLLGADLSGANLVGTNLTGAYLTDVIWTNFDDYKTNAEYNQLQADKATAETERDTANSERDTANAERDTAEAERDTAEAERDTAEAERDGLQAALNTANIDFDDMKGLRDGLQIALNTANINFDDMKGLRDGLQIALNTANIDFDDMKGLRDGLQIALNTANINFDDMKGLRDGLQIALNTANINFDDMKGLRDGLQIALNTANINFDDMKGLRDGLQIALNTANINFDDMEGLRDGLQIALNTANINFDDMKGLRDGLQDALDTANVNYDNMEGLRDGLAIDLTNMTANYDNVFSILENLDGSNKTVAELLEDTTSDRNQLKIKVDHSPFDLTDDNFEISDVLALVNDILS